jgi:hypothetical protein
MDDIPPIMNEYPVDTIYVCQPLPAIPDMMSEFPGQEATVIFTEVIEPGNGPGEFNVTRTWVATDSCHNSSTVIHHIVWIPESNIECSIIIPDTVLCNSHDVIISSLVTGGSGPYTYAWQIAGEKCFIQAGQGTPEIRIYVGWAEVKIILTITDVYGCISMCMITLDCFESFNTFAFTPLDFNADERAENINSTFHTIWNQEPTEQIQQLTYWPNPAIETMNLGFTSTVNQELKITLVNLFNQVVLENKFIARPGYNTHSMDLAHLPNGSYLMEVKNGTEMHTKVLVILRDE